MSRYMVLWKDEALAQLATIWMQAPNRSLVTAAVTSIDEQLANRPLQAGSELAEGLRRLEQSPLIVYFDVQPADRVVRVMAARTSG